jgi:hypothetical protein
MPAKNLTPADRLSLNKAEDLTTIASYRVATVGNEGVTSTPNGLMMSKRLTLLSVGEINPFCEEGVEDDIARFKTPEEAEEARDKYVREMAGVGITAKVVVTAVNAAGTVLAIDGEFISVPDDEFVDDGSGDWKDDECEGGMCNMDGVCDKHQSR